MLLLLQVLVAERLAVELLEAQFALRRQRRPARVESALERRTRQKH